MEKSETSVKESDAEKSNSDVEKIYQGSYLSVKANIPDEDLASVEEITFKFFKDGEEFESKVVNPAKDSDDSSDDDEEAADGYTLISHRLKAPDVPDDKESYLLDYHLFYKIKNKDGSIEDHQELSVERFLVFPRTAQLKVIWDNDSKPFSGFKFRVFQNGEQIGNVQHTFLHDTKNAKGETIPAGSVEFNLGLYPGFQIVQESPYEIVKQEVSKGRKREIKGDFKFRAVFLLPKKGYVRQYVNYLPEESGRAGVGHEVDVQVGVNSDDLKELELLGNAKKEIHFRVTYGPDGSEGIVKSKRKDNDFPTKILKSNNYDDITIEEKKANEIYQGKIALKDNIAEFKVCLGKAGGDTCKVEISGSDKFLNNNSIEADQVLEFENWRRIYLETISPDIMKEELYEDLDGKLKLSKQIAKKLELSASHMYVEVLNSKNQIFSFLGDSDRKSRARKAFIELEEAKESDKAYVLTGNNWREIPKSLAWEEKYPKKTLLVHVCHHLLKWRKDTDDENKGTNDFSGTLTEQKGFVNVEEKFGGFYMPFSGDNGDDGIIDFKWTADISKDDEVCKYDTSLEWEEEKYQEELFGELAVEVTAGQYFCSIDFFRLPYPELEVTKNCNEIEGDEDDDGRAVIKEVNLGKEITLNIKLPDENELANAEDDSSMVTGAQQSELCDYIKELFASGKEKLKESEASNRFKFEIRANVGTYASDVRYSDIEAALDDAYAQTYEHDRYSFKSELIPGQIEEIQLFVDELLGDTRFLFDSDGKIKLQVRYPEGNEYDEDKCFSVVKDKLQELFDGSENKKFSYHPALSDDGEPASGTYSLDEITNGRASNIREWHFALPKTSAMGLVGPGAFVGEKKSKECCPVKVEFSVQAHETSKGEVDKKNAVWPYSHVSDSKHLMKIILGAFGLKDDKNTEKHGHGEGKAGDCLLESEELCEACVSHGRSLDLTYIS